jgi:hypothetical protein
MASKFTVTSLMQEHPGGEQEAVQSGSCRAAPCHEAEPVSCSTAVQSIESTAHTDHAQVQDLKGAIRVYCRIRPPGRTNDTRSASSVQHLECPVADR